MKDYPTSDYVPEERLYAAHSMGGYCGLHKYIDSVTVPSSITEQDGHSQLQGRSGALVIPPSGRQQVSLRVMSNSLCASIFLERRLHDDV